MVFTDVVQSLTLVAGGALTIAYCVSHAGGLSFVLATAANASKLSLTEDASGAGRSQPLLWLFGASLYVLNVRPHLPTWNPGP